MASTTTTKTPSTKPSEIPMEVPSFLRKTYHMIDSCDPLIAGWSEDGTTFVVKNTTKFEREIIPQFFKHNKFSSFVRQLNFYSFRKIKYVDTIRLDPKLEAETANYWRFHHENFQRGCPQKLLDIKRMTANQGKNNNSNNASNNSNSNATPDSAESSEAMKSEIDTLKKQLEEMNKNMTQLTSMVQKVTLVDKKEDQNEDEQQPKSTSSTVKQEEETALPGAKRKKLDPSPEPVSSTALPTLATSSTTTASNKKTDADDVDDFITPTDAMFTDTMQLDLIPEQQPALREASDATDQDFVDQLFTAFQEEDQDDIPMMGDSTDDVLPDPSALVEFSSEEANATHNNSNKRADPELMDRLSEALAILPKEMQEQIVNRLIASIMSTDISLKTTASSPPNVVPSGKSRALSDVEDTMDDDSSSSAAAQQTPEVEGMPLAAATLASLLSYYSTLVKENNKMDAQKIVKNIPVIPCHA